MRGRVWNRWHQRSMQRVMKWIYRARKTGTGIGVIATRRKEQNRGGAYTYLSCYCWHLTHGFPFIFLKKCKWIATCLQISLSILLHDRGYARIGQCWWDSGSRRERESMCMCVWRNNCIILESVLGSSMEACDGVMQLNASI